MIEFPIQTERLLLRPFCDADLEPYCAEFTLEVTKYQYPDPFPDRDTAKAVMSGFVEDMKQGKMLELVILSRGGTFLGSIEAFGLTEDTPELGLWLKRSAQGKGYAYEALKGLIDALNASGAYRSYRYCVDIRNTASVRLVEKFGGEKGAFETVTTGSGKTLLSQTYFIPGNA